MNRVQVVLIGTQNRTFGPCLELPPADVGGWVGTRTRRPSLRASAGRAGSAMERWQHFVGLQRRRRERLAVAFGAVAAAEEAGTPDGHIDQAAA
jgi:hypothetical protein